MAFENTTPPSVSGTPAIGQTIATTLGEYDNNGGTISYSFQWYHSDDDSGTNRAAIEGATIAGYVPKITDRDKYLDCEVTAHDAGATGTKASIDLGSGDSGLVVTAKGDGASPTIGIRLIDNGGGNAISVGTVGGPYNTNISVQLATTDGDAAALTTAQGANKDLTFTAVTAGSADNSDTIAYVDPAANDQALSIGVSGGAITVNLATDSGGAITSTASDILAAINGDAGASALVTAALAAGSDGSGVVAAMAPTNLSGGGAGHTITSTAADVKAAIEGHTSSNNAVDVTYPSGGDGSGLMDVTPDGLTFEPLTGGADGVDAADVTTQSSNVVGPIKAIPSPALWAHYGFKR